MATKKPQAIVRFDSRAQIERAKRAARIKKWSFSRFCTESVVQATDQILETLKQSEQLMVRNDLPSLNQ